ncbi:MAG TPA: glycosyltransferase [Pyrinomonadaceae bacterium]|jgi:sugar transferase (PEP-CTERM/EpsH1 system associated)|nr:glycosyltransferase [Pyrinomonadaceae bacterium]
MHILWLKTELLHPVDKGGKIRTYNMLKELKRQHRITYLALDDGTAGAAERESALEYCHELIAIRHQPREKFTAGFYAELLMNLASRLPYAIKKYESAKMRTEIVKRVQAEDVDLVVCDFLAPAANVPFDLGCPTVLFQHNVEAMIWQRHYQVQSNWLKKAYLFRQWLMMRTFERRMCHRFDAVVAVSTEDREQMQNEYGAVAVFDVPTGVDTEFFRPSGRERADLHNIVFTGSMDWLPNEDAISYFTEQIMPRIKQVIPEATLTVVGRNPYPSLLELARRDSSVIVTGRVDDVRPYMERAAAYVVPLRIGGGTRLKIYEAMAMEKAIVSTSIGAEGLPVKDGAELLLADTAESFASAVIRVLQEPSVARSLGAAAAATVREQFGWGRVAERFGRICEDAVAESQAEARPLGRAPAERPPAENSNTALPDGRASAWIETR